MARLLEQYRKEIAPQLQKSCPYPNIMAVPRIDKIVLNMGVGEAATDKKVLNGAMSDLALIAGQQPMMTYARKSIANFKIRAGWPIGCKVTLRRARMYEFLERLISIAIPRMRDFRGLNEKSFDGFGNYSFGIQEQIVFPEIDYDKIDKLRGLDITIATTAKTDEEARALLLAFDFPLKNREEKKK